MKTIYSRVIWDELGLKDFKIHLEEPKKVEELVINWVKTENFDRVEEVLKDLSWISKTTYETYYDGPFYGFTQHEDSYFEDKDGHKCDLLIHDSGMLTTILDMSIRTRISPSELRFIADVLEAFQSRVPKVEGCSLDGNWGYKVENGKEINEN